MTKILDDLMDIVGGDQSVTYVGFVRDHSGSMNEPLPDDPDKTKKEMAKSNFNEYIETLKKESDKDMETLVTIVEFDDKVRVDRTKLIKEVEHLDNYWTGGMTALYDAIAKAIGEVSRAMSQDRRTNKAALIVIQTDGAENYSKEYSGREGQKKLQEYIKDLEDTGLWTFIFLGENIDEKLADEIGMTPMNFMKTEATARSYMATNAAVKDGLTGYYNLRKAGATQSKNFFKDGLIKLDEEEEENGS